MQVVDVFTNIIPTPIPDNNKLKEFVNGQAMSIGAGALAFKVDGSGMWLGANKFADAPFRVDMAGNAVINSIVITGGEISYGKTSFTDSVHAGYYLGPEGVYFGAAGDSSKLKYSVSTGSFDFVGTISGRSSATLAAAINTSGNVITELINTKLDTSAKQILGDFTFGASGAIKMITDANNGLWISPTGILGKKSGSTTFAITTSGDATFGGTLSAAAGTLGTITAATITGGTIDGVTITGGTVRTSSGSSRCVLDGGNNIISIFSSNVERIRITEDRVNFINSSGNTIGRLYTPSTTVVQLEALNGNYLMLNAAGSSYWVEFQNAGNTIAYVSSGGLTIASGKKITTPEVSATYLTSVNSLRFTSTSSPLTDNGTIYYNGSHFYGRIGGAWYQLD